MNKKTIILLGFILLKFVLQYVLINPVYDLQRDEYLHLDQANHLAWGYISVPPMTSWIAYLIKLFGNGVFWVKFFPALFGVFTLILVWKIIEMLGGSLFALILGALCFTGCAILRINILFQPNSLDIFFWTLVYFCIIKYIVTSHTKWLLTAGVSLAFGILSKYNILFLAAGLFPALLLTQQRKIFTEKSLYIGGVIALIIIIPNFIWQWKNDFPTIRQLKELADTQLVNVKRADFAKEQLLFFVNSFFVIIAAFIGLLFYVPFRKFRFLFWAYIFTLSLFIYFKAKAYYALGLYPVLIPFGAVYLDKLTLEGWKKLLRPVLAFLVIVLSVPFMLIAFPFRSPEAIQKKSERYKSLGLLRWEDGKDHALPQDFADMIGWKELAKTADSVYELLPDKASTIIICDNYGQAGAINYYSKFKNINAVSFNADYINLFKLDIKINNVILVKEADDDDSTRVKEKLLFDSVTLVGVNNNPYSREQGTRLYLLKGAKADINQLLRKKIMERKTQH